MFHFSKTNYFKEVDFGKRGSDIQNEHTNGEGLSSELTCLPSYFRDIIKI